MAAVAFDSLDYAHQLEAAGMPREQAEVVAKGLTTMFIHNFESLVTKDYLDTRFSEQSVRMELLATEIDAKLEALSANVDAKLGSLSANMDASLESLSTSMDAKLKLLSAEIDGKLGKLYVMFGVIMVGLALPIIQTLINWFA